MGDCAMSVQHVISAGHAPLRHHPTAPAAAKARATELGQSSRCPTSTASVATGLRLRVADLAQIGLGFEEMVACTGVCRRELLAILKTNVPLCLRFLAVPEDA